MEDTPFYQWVKKRVSEIGDDAKVEIANKLLEFYFGGYDPHAEVKGINWSYDGSPRDLWAEMSEIVGDDITWD